MDNNNHALFYQSENGDRIYSADSFSDWLKKFFTTGVFTGDLQVIANEGMSITVEPGYCNINGKVKFWSQNEIMDVTTAHSTYDRIDNVVIERNDTLRDFILKVVTGGATDTPTAPLPVRNESTYQIVLAHIYVKAGSTSIEQADIYDTRSDRDLCGIVAGTVEEIDFSQIQRQYDSYMELYKQGLIDFENETEAEITQWFELYRNRAGADFSTWETTERAKYEDFMDAFELAFNTWFSNMQGQLSSDAATNLQTQIDSIKNIYKQGKRIFLPATIAYKSGKKIILPAVAN